MITVQRAGSATDIDAVRGLMREFNRWVMAEIAETDNPSIFAEFELELAGLPGRYGPPSGCLVLARLHGDPAGCVAFYAHDAITVEIKRMFVPARARVAGYRRALLSSHHSMHAAHAIYHRAGFRDVPPSAAFPGVVAGVDVCMAMALTADTSP